MTLQRISPEDARRRIDAGALLVDIREPDEFRREHIPGARNIPVAKLTSIADSAGVVYHCRSGGRTDANCQRLATATQGGEGFLLDGGLEAWRKAGLPITADRRAPLEVMRQVQIAAGLLVLIGVVLGLTINPGFFGLSAFVGAGLTFAGVSGWCGMARLLAMAPWNRPARAA